MPVKQDVFLLFHIGVEINLTTPPMLKFHPGLYLLWLS